MTNTLGNKQSCLSKKYLVNNYFIKSCSKSKTRAKLGSSYTSITKNSKKLCSPMI